MECAKCMEKTLEITFTVRVVMYRLRGDGLWDVLMVHNIESGKKREGWGLPGGGARTREGEILVDAAIRELFEETGLVVLPSDLKIVSRVLAYGSKTHWNCSSSVIIYNPAMGEITTNNDPDGTVDDVGWVSCEKIMELYASGINRGDSVDSKGRRYYINHLRAILFEVLYNA